nr:hypothetical protein [Ardenticatena sp.]
MSPMSSLRRGKGKLEIDWEEMESIEAEHRAGRGLFGGDPYLRHARNPHIPPEPARWFCLAHASEEHRARLRAFLTSAPVELEIGSGDGRFIVEWAAIYPDRHFLAFEVRGRLVHTMYRAIEERGLTNVWVCDDDARAAIPEIVPPATVDVVHILMPDPWWKQRHARRRLFSLHMLSILAQVLKPGGILRFESDVEGYPEVLDRLIERHPDFEPHDPALAERFANAPLTTRQQWCVEHGVPIFRRFYRRRATERSPAQEQS